MSSSETPDNINEFEQAHTEDGSPSPAPDKRRRVRACDMCRRRKVRCDGARMPGNRCSNCIAFKYSCTYAQASKRRYADPERVYVQNLETQLSQTQELLQKLSSRLEVVDPANSLMTARMPPFPMDQRPEADTIQSPSKISLIPEKTLRSMMTYDPKEKDLEPSDDETTLRQNLEMSIRHLSLDPQRPHFLGKSSGLAFLQTALDMKEQFAGPPPHGNRIPLAGARPEFWTEHPWKHLPQYPYPFQAFPDQILMVQLVDAYFANYNIYVPILHRPTFEKGIREGFHLVDQGFGATVLLVCALGAKFTEDPRTLLDGTDNRHSAGWKWFQPVQATRRAIRLSQPRIYDLQTAVLVAHFLHASSSPQSSFAVVGEAIRTAQDLGAHRKKMYATMSTAEGELLRRAFWGLVFFDRTLCSTLGRACCIQDEDFDVDYPIECDDEYWFTDDPSQSFKQPAGKPSQLSFFVALIRLTHIHGCVLRTIYAINKSKTLLGFSTPDSEQEIVTEIDSALNKWIDMVPDHLKWNPHMKNLTFLNQSAFLYTTYYFLQITIHRPYIPSPRRPSPLSFPSLAICTNAARSCIHVLDVQYNRSASPTYQNMMALFCAAVVLLLNIWGNKRAGTSAGNIVTREMADVHKVMVMLKALETKWHTAGCVLDVLCELAAVGDVLLPPYQVHPMSGQSTDAGQPIPSHPGTPPTSHSTANPGRGASSHSQERMETYTESSVAPSGIAQPSYNVPGISLPTHSEELGRFTLHPAFNSGVNPTSPSLLQTNWNSFASGSSAGSSSPSMSSGRPDHDTIFTPDLMQTAEQYSSNSRHLSSYTIPSAGQSQQPSRSNSNNAINTAPSSSPWADFPNSLDNDTISMWSSVPVSMVWEDWGRYIMDISGMGSTGDPNAGP